MKLTYKNKHGHPNPVLRLGKTLPVLRRQRRLVVRALAKSVDSAQLEHDNISPSYFNDEPDDELLHAESLVGELIVTCRLRSLLDDIEGEIEEVLDDQKSGAGT
jgi:hypothetical protein